MRLFSPTEWHIARVVLTTYVQAKSFCETVLNQVWAIDSLKLMVSQSGMTR